MYHSPLPTPERNAFICMEDFFRNDDKVRENVGGKKEKVMGWAYVI